MEHYGCLDAARRRSRQRAAERLADALNALWEAPAAAGTWLWFCFLVWQRRATARHHLAGLDDRQLRDAGLSREWAEHEASKPFWRA